jgi:hypothetical protein
VKSPQRPAAIILYHAGVHRAKSNLPAFFSIAEICDSIAFKGGRVAASFNRSITAMRSATAVIAYPLT